MNKNHTIDLDQLFVEYFNEYLCGNKAARIVADGLDQVGVGLMPSVDHCAIRTLDVNARAKEIQALGYQYDNKIGVLEFENWWAKVYRKPGYPALFIDQGFDGERGRDSLIPGWVKAHGDQCFHHFAILVENIESAIGALNKKGVEFAGEVIGEPGTDLRQIFTKPEMKSGEVYTVLELIERHHGYDGFLPPQADGLMESTRQSA